MEKVFTSGPMQNIDWESNGIERCIPHLMANSANAMLETGINLQMWNNNTPKTTASFNENIENDFNRYCKEEINKKNEFMRQYNYDSDNHNIITEIFTDTDEDFSAWTNSKIITLIKSGIIYKEKSDFHVCSNCGNLIAESAASLSSNCKMCGSNDIKIRQDIGLFIDIPDKKAALIESKLYSPINDSVEKDLYNRFKLLPPRTFINKRRHSGVALEIAGFSGFVVNPKIAISLLPEYSAMKLGVNEVIQIQGVSTAANTIPYTSIMNDGSFENKYIFINKAPSGVLSDNKDLGSEFYGYLLGNLVSKTKLMTANELSQIKSEYLGIKERLVIAMQWLKNEKATSCINLSGEIVDDMGTLNDYLKIGKFNDAMKIAKKIVNTHIVHNYANQCYLNNTRLTKDDILALSTVLAPIFGSS